MKKQKQLRELSIPRAMWPTMALADTEAVPSFYMSVPSTIFSFIYVNAPKNIKLFKLVPLNPEVLVSANASASV